MEDWCLFTRFKRRRRTDGLQIGMFIGNYNEHIKIICTNLQTDDCNQANNRLVSKDVDITMWMDYLNSTDQHPLQDIGQLICCSFCSFFSSFPGHSNVVDW